MTSKQAIKGAAACFVRIAGTDGMEVRVSKREVLSVADMLDESFGTEWWFIHDDDLIIDCYATEKAT